jgi:hypothetical protein
MTKGTKKVIFFSTVAAIFGTVLYLYIRYKKNQQIELQANGKRAYFIKNGFVYTLEKKQGYAKKNGEWAGIIVESYKDDKDYWLANNTKGQPILLKKSEVKID